MIKKEESKGCDSGQQIACKNPPENNKIFGKFELDDIILGVVILAILLDDSDDNILLIALAVIFLTGLN